MSDSLYEGDHRKLFKAFLKLVDDTEAQLRAILDASSWEDVNSLLSVGGGEGAFDAFLLKQAPRARICYLDPSEEQCSAFRQHMEKENCLDRVEEIAQTTFQDYAVSRTFDRILSLFSWFYIGTDEVWLTKLLDLLALNGTAFLLLPNQRSIETVFYRALSPDPRMSLIGDEVVGAIQKLDCTVIKHTGTKWLALNDLFDNEQLSELSNGSLALAAFAAERPVRTFTSVELEEIARLLKANQTGLGVPLSWDLILITRNR